mmetsp:Transcript_23564/g.19783  ORF Transcript_23564/g.19783 Transcript_23564/m.19783 type:complete len:98 (-) Transcript_23564:1-294(-)
MRDDAQLPRAVRVLERRWFLMYFGTSYATALHLALHRLKTQVRGTGHYDQLKLPRPPQVKSVEVPAPSIEPAGVARRALLPALDGGVSGHLLTTGRS